MGKPNTCLYDHAMSLGTNIKLLIDGTPGASYAKIAAHLQCDPQAIQVLVARDSMRSKYSSGIAKFFDISLELLIDGTPEEITQHLLNRARVKGSDPHLSISSDTGKEFFSLLARESVPVYLAGVPVTAVVTTGSGEYQEMTDTKDGGRIAWPSSDKTAYAVRISGEHLAPRARHGEFAIVEPSHEAGPGDEVIVYPSDSASAIIGQLLFERDGRVYLEDLNGRGQRTSIERTQISKIHLVAGIAKSALLLGQSKAA